jgi:hypothetical protein
VLETDESYPAPGLLTIVQTQKRPVLRLPLARLRPGAKPGLGIFKLSYCWIVVLPAEVVVVEPTLACC